MEFPSTSDETGVRRRQPASKGVAVSPADIGRDVILDETEKKMLHGT
jgi:hypothetical protein